MNKSKEVCPALPVLDNHQLTPKYLQGRDGQFAPPPMFPNVEPLSHYVGKVNVYTVLPMCEEKISFHPLVFTYIRPFYNVTLY